MTPRRRGVRATLRLSVVVVVLAGVDCASGSAGIPRALQGYEVLVPGRDTVSHAFAAALRDRGFRVRREVRGGGRPTAALIYFTFREPQQAQNWLHARLFDTRTGVILGAAMLRLDSLGLDARSRATLLVDSLTSP